MSTLLLHPGFVATRPEEASRFARALKTTVTSIVLRVADGKRTVLVDGRRADLIWEALRYNCPVAAFWDGAADHGLPHVKNKRWVPLSTDGRSVWARTYRLEDERAPEPPPSVWDWEAWCERTGAGTLSWGDWPLPVRTWDRVTGKETTFWRPAAWLNLRNAAEWPGRLLDTTIVCEKSARKWVRESDLPANLDPAEVIGLGRDERLDKEIWATAAALRQRCVLTPDPRDTQGRMTFTLRTAVERMPREESVQVYANGWPLRLLDREYLKWMVYDGEIGDTSDPPTPATRRTTYKVMTDEEGRPLLLPSRTRPGKFVRPPKRAFTAWMWTASPVTKKGDPNYLHLAVKNWLAESDAGCAGRDGAEFDGTYREPWLPTLAAWGNMYATADLVDDRPERDPFHGSGYWSDKVVRPVLCVTEEARVTREVAPAGAFGCERATYHTEYWYKEPLLGEPANAFVSTGHSNAYGPPDPWASQGYPEWLQIIGTRYWKGMGKKGARLRAAATEGDDDPTPANWGLGLVENEGSGRMQVRDRWTPMSGLEFDTDYVPTQPSDDPAVNWRRAWRILTELERLNTPRLKGGGEEAGLMQVLEEHWGEEEAEHQRGMLRAQWVGHGMSDMLGDEPIIGEVTVAFGKRPRTEATQKHPSGRVNKRGVLDLLAECEVRAIQAVTRQRLLDVKRQRRAAARTLERRRRETEPADRVGVLEVRGRRFERCKYPELIREAVLVAAGQWDEEPEGMVSTPHGTTSTLHSVPEGAYRLPSRRGLAFERLFV